jgi:hypothetical protein
VPALRIYFEGDNCLRPGLHAFFRQVLERARANGWTVNLISTDGTPKRDFGIALRSHPEAWNILLLDSESTDAHRRPTQPIASEGWTTRPESVFWMVEMMESWFYADKEALGGYYKQGFNSGAMSANPQVEQISKKDLAEGLKTATRNTQKGAYHKTKHAPDLLALIDPTRVRNAAPNCDRLFATVLAKLG